MQNRGGVNPVIILDSSGNAMGGSDFPLNVSGVFGGKIKAVSVTPVVTVGNAYGNNFVIGGKLTFANLFGTSKSGIVISARVKSAVGLSQGMQLWLFANDPTNTTITDCATMSLAAADISKMSGNIPLIATSGIGGGFNYADGVAQAHVLPGTDMYEVLTTNLALSSNFGSTGDITVTLAVQPDAN